MSCDFYDGTIKRMADITEQSFARQEAILAEIKSEARDFSERTERKLNRIRETVKDVKHNMTRQKIIMTNNNCCRTNYIRSSRPLSEVKSLCYNPPRKSTNSR
ncbi:MAG: hypothetical protein IKQ95_10040 [Synergistaceae bacterium]|nr:hypothetical protein [Synergistaceae bacterium]